MRRDHIDHKDLKRSMIKALANGATHPVINRVEADYSGSCTDKQFVVRTSRPTTHADGSPGQGTYLCQETWVRCGRCSNCMRTRAWKWSRRAELECRQSILSWMGTLTLSPTHRSRVDATARVDYKAFNAMADFDQLTSDEQFAWKVGVIYPDLARYKMQLRNLSGSKLRTLIVAEPHEDGQPHFHMLVHEHDRKGTLTRDILRDQWKLGFTKWKMIDDHTTDARYVCKYISKSGAVRPRASAQYGKMSLAILAAFQRDNGVSVPSPTLLDGTAGIPNIQMDVNKP